MPAKLSGRLRGGHCVLLALSIAFAGCSSSTTTATPTAPSTFVMTWNSLAFPATGIGRAAGTTLVVTLWNTGAAAAPVASATNSNADEFPWTTTCQIGGSLAAASNCTMTVQFKPNAAGARTATLTINANSTTQTLSLTGTGATISPQLSISGAGDTAPTLFLLSVTGATPAGALDLHTIYTPAQGNPALPFDTTRWTADTSGAVTASVTTENRGTYEHWLIDLTSGLATNHVFHAVP
jgi:hypothetical protein